MDKIDRLGWAAGESYVSYGARFGLRVNDPAWLEPLRGVLPEGRAAPGERVPRLYSVRVGREPSRPGVKSYHLVYEDHVRIARTLDRKEVLDALARHARLYVAERARRRVFVHAGVVGVGGGAILVPGRSMSGKTTLVAELLRAGATYYSDEYAVLDERGRVHPFPKPLSMREPGELAQEEVPVEAFGARSGTEPLPVTLVLVSRFQAGRRFRPRRLSPGEAVLALLANAVPARRAPERVLSVLERALAGATVLKGDRGEARDVAARLLERFADSSRRV